MNEINFSYLEDKTLFEGSYQDISFAGQITQDKIEITSFDSDLVTPAWYEDTESFVRDNSPKILIALKDDYLYGHFFYEVYTCPICGKRVIQDTFNFCPSCGKPVKVIYTEESDRLEKQRDFYEDDRGMMREVKIDPEKTVEISDDSITIKGDVVKVDPIIASTIENLYREFGYKVIKK